MNDQSDKTRMRTASPKSPETPEDETVAIPVDAHTSDDATVVKPQDLKPKEHVEEETVLKPSANEDATQLIPEAGISQADDETIAMSVDARAMNLDATRIQQKSGNTDRNFASATTQLNPKRHTTDDSPTISMSDEATEEDFRTSLTRPGVESLSLEPGMELKNRFVLQKKIGSGGMGSIFLAKDKRKEELRDRDSLVVIKVLKDELHDNFDAVVSLQREAKKSQALSHPNIVTVYDFDREDNTFFINMEYLQGESLDRFIGRNAFRQEKQVQILQYIEYMARGLAYAHQEGFVHADFKPANVYLTEQGQIKILDFGIAQAVRSNIASQKGDDTVFDPMSLGAMTPNYASLEMLENERPVFADDVYALACVAYEMLTGRHPYVIDGKKVNAKDAQEKGMLVEPIKGLTRRQMHAIQKGLAFKRENRFADAGEFIDAIKPRVKIKQSILALIAVLSVTVFVSWYMLAAKSDAVIGFDDLPPSMAEIVTTIKSGDEIFESGDINQAHKLYALAWEASFDLGDESSRDNYKLKVILDRRVNKVIESIINKARTPDVDEFMLMQYELALEFLKKDELGTMDEKIDQALEYIGEQLDKSGKP